MAFTVPVLSTYAGGDDDYIAKFNSDAASLNNAFTGIQSDVNSMQTSTGSALIEDWIRKGPTSESWPDAVFGAYSLVLDITDISSGNLKLTSANDSNTSVAAIGGTRRFVIGDLTLALSTVGLADGPHTVYFGVNAESNIGLVAKASTTLSEVAIPLYSVPITVSVTGTVFAITTNSTPTRMSKTVYWDNTVEQLRQETPQIISIWFGDVSATNDQDVHLKVKIPFDHYLDAVNVQTDSASGATTITVQENATNVLLGSVTTLTDVDLVFQTGYSAGYAMVGGTVYETQFSTASGSMVSGTISFQVRRAFNAPLAN